MNDLELQSSIRNVVEHAASPVTAAEAKIRAGSKSSSSRIGFRLARVSTTTKILIGVASAGVLAVVVALTVGPAIVGTPTSTTPTTSPGTVGPGNSIPVALVTCLQGPPTSVGCPATAAEASAALGIPVPEPGHLPSNWHLNSRALRYFAPRAWNGFHPAQTDFNESWSPPGTDITAVKYPTYIELEVHIRNAGDVGCQRGWDCVHLASGVEASGTLQDGSTWLDWSYRGMGLKVITQGVSAREVLAFINGLDFPRQ
jgi:hypothetical protein